MRAGEPIVEIRHRGGRGLEEARRLLRESIQIADEAPAAGASGARPDSRKESTMTDVAVGEHPIAAPPPRAPYDSRDATVLGGAAVAAAFWRCVAHCGDRRGFSRSSA